MGTSCNGICHRYKAPRPIGSSRYGIGQKRCNHCNIFMEWDGLFCPCCNLRLRQSPRSSKCKKRFLKEITKAI